MPTSFDAAVQDGVLAPNILAEVLDAFERRGLEAAQRRLQRLRKETAFQLTPQNRELLDRQLFDLLVEYFVRDA